jgi:hypothetical protein
VLDWVAAALVAAAIFAVPGFAIWLSSGGLRGWDAAGAVAAISAGLLALAFHARSRRRGETAAIVVGGGALAWLAVFGAFIALFGAAICGTGRLATTVSWVGFVGVYLGVGAWSLLGRYRPVWGLPLAVGLAALVHYGALALIPGGRGHCET